MLTANEQQRIRSFALGVLQVKGWSGPPERLAPSGRAGITDWQKYRYQGENGYPVLYIDDLGSIPNLDGIPGIEFYQQRARLRADTGDFVVLTHPLEESYEEYNRTYLGLSSPAVIKVDNYGYHPLFITRNLSKDREQLSDIAKVAGIRGGIVIHPFIGSKDVWNLAGILTRFKAGAVKVIAPYPYVTDFINDKVEFTKALGSVVGADSVVDTLIARNEQDVILRLEEMLRTYPTVAIKMRNYASAMGNIVFDRNSVQGMSESERAKFIKANLWTLNWKDNEPLCIVRWYDDVLASPSSHLWIPPNGQGLPVVEGVFEQLLEGDTRVFAGSKPAQLPEKLKAELVTKTLQLGIFLQEIGYVGRCSFDTIIHGPVLTDARLKFVECNGRWGGTSLPMYLFKRIFGSGVPFNYLARDYTNHRLKGRHFKDLLQAFGNCLFNKDTGQGHCILYNVGCLEPFGKFDVMVLGDSDSELRQRAFVEVPKLVDKLF